MKRARSRLLGRSTKPRASEPHLTRSFPPFPQRSPPRLLTVAACGGLEPAPDGRLRRTYPHLLHSIAPPCVGTFVAHSRSLKKSDFGRRQTFILADGSERASDQGAGSDGAVWSCSHCARRRSPIVFSHLLATRLGGVSGGKETHRWRDSSHTAMVGAGKFGSAKLLMATATYPGKPSLSQ
jgi:hypothetical protein